MPGTTVVAPMAGRGAKRYNVPDGGDTMVNQTIPYRGGGWPVVVACGRPDHCTFTCPLSCCASNRPSESGTSDWVGLFTWSNPFLGFGNIWNWKKKEF